MRMGFSYIYDRDAQLNSDKQQNAVVLGSCRVVPSNLFLITDAGCKYLNAAAIWCWPQHGSQEFRPSCLLIGAY